jgi:hypothetical protein
VSHETALRTAIAYLADLEAELEERGAAPSFVAQAAMSAGLLYQLDCSRQLVAALERQAANISCLSNLNGREVLFDLNELRSWCRSVEAKIARICCSGTADAAA